MKAAIYEHFQSNISIESLPDPICEDLDVIIKVAATGICRSDWHGWMGHDGDISLPHVPGHEFAGIIIEKGSAVKNFQLGDRVVAPFCCGCAKCIQCKQGDSHICDYYFQPGFTAWGSFAEYVRIPQADFNLHRLPEEIDMVTAASLGCRFMTAYRAVVTKAKLNKNQFLTVFGCGGVGLSVIMIAKSLGIQVIAIDIHRDALMKAEKLEANHCILSSSHEQLVEEIKEYTQGGAHACIDAFGSIQNGIDGLMSLRKKGKLIQVGLLKEGKALPDKILSRLIADELEIYGSHGMPVSDYPSLFELILHKDLDPGLLIEQKLTLEEGVQFLCRMGDMNYSGITVVDQI